MPEDKPDLKETIRNALMANELKRENERLRKERGSLLQELGEARADVEDLKFSERLAEQRKRRITELHEEKKALEEKVEHYRGEAKRAKAREGYWKGVAKALRGDEEEAEEE